MNEFYRGHRIRLTRASLWNAVIIHDETGVVLPTKATALLREGRFVAIARAVGLIDLYLDGIKSDRGELFEKVSVELGAVTAAWGRHGRPGSAEASRRVERQA